MESRRKAEIEAKKAKLAELKRARLERQATLAETKSSGRGTPAAGAERERGPSTRAQLDELVSSLLGNSNSASASSALVSPGASPREPGTARIGPTAAGNVTASGRTSRLSEAATATTTTSDRDAASRDGDAVTGQTAGAGSAGSVVGEASSSELASRGSIDTSAAPAAAPLPPPKPKPTTYDKAIQTLPLQNDRSSDRRRGISTGTGQVSDDEEDDADDVEAALAKTAIATEAEIRARILREIEMQKEIDRLEAEQRAREAERKRDEALTSSDLAGILASNEFQSFLDTSSKFVERALNDDYDYLRDYTIGDGDGEDAGSAAKGKRVKLTCAFYDERWCRNRSVTSLDWSPKYPELCVTAYNKNAMSASDPDGIACVWNLHLVDRPEFVFHSQSDVLSVAFSPFHPNLIIGGTYAGQILIWDTRAKSLPVLKSPLSAAGHTHPVYSLALVGTQNAHNLISASTDGTICSWALDMLARPHETLELVHPQHAKTDEVSVTSLAFAGNETATLLVGTEEGNIYAANRYDRAGAKAGLLQGETYRSHSGPVLGIDYHPLAGPIDFSDLFLSCGVDWTVKLWRSKGAHTATSSVAGRSAATGHSAASSRSAAANAANSGIPPLYTFEEANDYVLDARWHPAHPALFGSVDASGKFDLWNLNIDTEVPAVSTIVNDSGQKRGLNKLAWDRRDGRHAAIGASDGKVIVYDIGSMAVPRENEWDLLRRTLNGMQSQNVVGR